MQPRPRLDHRLDQRRRQAQDARLRHRAARTGTRAMRAAALRAAAARLTCPHCGSRDTERLAAFGSTACKALLPLPRLPRAVRALQADLVRHEPALPSVARQEPCAPRPTRPSSSRSTCPHELARAVPLHPGPVPDAAHGRSTARSCAARTRSAPAPTTASCASASARCRAACSRPGSTSAAGRRHDAGDDARRAASSCRSIRPRSGTTSASPAAAASRRSCRS